jgi:YfiH family protein
MWVLRDGLWKDTEFPFFNLVTTRGLGNMRDPDARKDFCLEHGINPEGLVTAQQVHGCKVAVVTRADGGQEIEAADGLVTADPGVSIAIFTADCVPVFFAGAAGKKVAGIAHAGWRGLEAGIIGKTVELLKNEFGVAAEEVTAAIGPHIQKCCYETGPELREKFGVHSSEKNLDLSSIALKQLEAAGIRRVSASGLCTCHERGLFFSFRGEKTDNRIMSLIKI